MAFLGNTVEIPLGIVGFIGSDNPTEALPGHLVRADGITYESGLIGKEGGATKYNSTVISGAPSVIGGWDWWPSDGVQRMVVALSDGTLKKDSGAGDFTVTLKSGLTVSSVVPVFVEGGKEVAANNRKLFAFTAKNVVQVLSGDAATTTDITTPPADWTGANQPSFGLIHEARLWGGGNANDPHRLYYSQTTAHENFTGATSGSLSVYPGEGEKLIGAVSFAGDSKFKGLLIAFKYPRGIYLVDTTSPTVADWRVARLTLQSGMASPLAFAVAYDDLIFLDAAGNFQLLSSITESGNLEARNLSAVAELGDFFRSQVDVSSLTKVRAVFYGAKNEAHFVMQRSGFTTNNMRFVVDFNRIDTPRFRYSTRDISESLWIRRDASGILRPMIGDNAGFVWRLDQAARSKDGMGYLCEFQIPPLDLSHLDPVLGTKAKISKFLELIVEPRGNHDLAVDIIWDGKTVHTTSFNMGGTLGIPLDQLKLDLDPLGVDPPVVSKKRRALGGGRFFSFRARNNNAAEDIAVSKAFLHYLVGSERP